MENIDTKETREKYLKELKEFISKIPKLQNIHQEILRKDIEEKAKKLKEIVEILSPIYEKELESVREYIKQNHNKDERLFLKTTFEIMGREEREEAHSNVIAYLLEQKGGRELLKAILNKIEDEVSHSIISLIDKNRGYEVRREHPINSGIIDIFIKSEDFVIVIENKFMARISRGGEKWEKQTDRYKKEIDKKYKNLNKIYIILDYKGEEESKGWFTIDYNDILDSLERVNYKFNNDNIFIEYKYLLKRIINSIDEIDIDNLEEVESLSLLNNIKMEVERWI
jgi:hypothetical protein